MKNPTTVEVKHALELNLRETFFIIRQEKVDENISTRVWYDIKEYKVLKLEVNEASKSPIIVINKDLKSEVALAMNEEVFIDYKGAVTLGRQMNKEEKMKEKRAFDDAKAQVVSSEKILKFFDDLEKVTDLDKNKEEGDVVLVVEG